MHEARNRILGTSAKEVAEYPKPLSGTETWHLPHDLHSDFQILLEGGERLGENWIIAELKL